MSTVWFDVTTVWTWQRPAVGIVRTEIECAYHALAEQELGRDYKFCRFSSVDGYIEVQGNELKFRLDQIKHGVTPKSDFPTHVVQIDPVPLSFEQRSKEFILKALSKLPVKTHARLLRALHRRRQGVLLSIDALRKAKAAAKQLFRPEQSPVYVPPQAFQLELETDRHPFNAGDTYISLGLDWDQKDLTYLYRIKKAYNLHVLLFCYDVIPVTLPHLCVGDVASRFANYFSKVAWCADKILCISECSKRDLETLLHQLGTPVPALEVVKLGCQLNDSATALSPALANLVAKPFILFVSTIERRKNHEILYRAYTRLVDKGVADLPNLIFVGMAGWGVNDLLSDITLDPRTQNKIVMLNHVSDGDLLHLYKNCMATAFPSLYEGWGLPVAESLALGKYCLASNAASIPEVGGDLLEYLDPWNVQAWADAIELLVTDPTELDRRTTRIRTEYRQVAWAETSRTVFESAARIS